MRTLIGIMAATIVTFMSLVPVALPVDITASVSVVSTCDVAATGPLTFGSLQPGTTSTPMTSTVSEPHGNNAVIPKVSGTQWNGVSNSMPVGQTVWNSTSITTSTPLTGSGVSIGDTISHGSPTTVSFAVAIPDGQTVDNYAQTITFSVSC